MEAILPIPEDTVVDIPSVAEVAYLQDGEVSMTVTRGAVDLVANKNCPLYQMLCSGRGR